MSEVLQLRGYTLCKYTWFCGFNQTQIRVNLLLSAGCRSIPAACPAASVPTGCCQTEPEVASTRPAVPVSTMGSSTNQDRRSQWTATPGWSTDEQTKDTHDPNISARSLFVIYPRLCVRSLCSGRKFTCTDNECDAVCGLYGDGHYITFDEKRFDFNGQCEYTLLQVNQGRRFGVLLSHSEQSGPVMCSV